MKTREIGRARKSAEAGDYVLVKLNNYGEIFLTAGETINIDDILYYNHCKQKVYKTKTINSKSNQKIIDDKSHQEKTMDSTKVVLYLTILVAVINGLIQTLLAVQGYLSVGQAASITSIVAILSMFVAVINQIIPIFSNFVTAMKEDIELRKKGL